MHGTIAHAVAALIAGSRDTDLLVGLQTTPPLRPLYLVMGLVLLVGTIVDLLWTTLWDDKGAGPLSSRLMTGAWQGLRRLSSERSWVLSLGGPLVLMLNLVMWVGFIWAGWTLVFASGENALVHARSSDPVTWTGRIDFVAQAMFTMGNGDFYPARAVWRVATALATASGLLSVTLIVTYIISVLGGVIENRSFANSVMALGRRSEAVIRTGWNGEDLHQFDPVLDTLSSELSHLAADNKTHPILHHYRSTEGRNSSVLAIAVFDEALTLLRFGIPEEYHPNDVLVEIAHSTARSYLDAFTDTVEPADRAPPPPNLGRLRSEGIPTVSDEQFVEALADLDERRRLLRGVVEAGGWSWPPAEHEAK